MDVLLSLPIVSYFFSTSLTSWSTSLNLLFFYMTWTTLVLSHSPLKLELVGTTALRALLWLVPSLVFLAFDTLVPSLSQTMKHHGASVFPPRDARAVAKLVGLALFNFALETAVEAATSLGLSHLLGAPVFRTSTTLPLPWQMIKHLAILLTAREVLTYYIHRHLLHGHPLALPSSLSLSKSKRNNNSPKITTTTTLPSLHTQYAHTTTPRSPTSLNLKTDHPFPYLLHRFLPLYLPALALHYSHSQSLHILTFFVYVALATLDETLAMSGYKVVAPLGGILLGGVARRTAAHYASGGRGNFGGWGVLDWVHGTGTGTG
ncbi:hypothetical protein N658DRAFT_404754, partial [Parathielavia hyrcaniae]